MAVRYFNKRNKDLIMIMGMIIDKIPEMVESLKLDGANKRKLNTCATFFQNVFTETIQSVDREQQRALKRAAKHNRLVVVADTNVSYEAELVDEGQDALNTLIDAVLSVHCWDCNTAEKEASCELKKALLGFHIPVLHEECSTGECPYFQGKRK